MGIPLAVLSAQTEEILKLKASLIFLISFYYSFHAVGIEITLNQPPGDYRVYNLDGKGLKRTASAKDFKKFKFQLPNKFIIRNNSGDLNLEASLARWRRETPIAHGNPRTQRGIGFFPFTDESGVPRYIALNHIIKRYGDKLDYNYAGYRPKKVKQPTSAGQTASRPSVVKKPIAAKPQVTSSIPTKSPIKANVDTTAATSDTGYTDKSTFEPAPAISKVPVPSVNPKKSVALSSKEPEETFNLSPTQKARRERLEKNAISASVLKKAGAQLDQNKKPVAKAKKSPRSKPAGAAAGTRGVQKKVTVRACGKNFKVPKYSAPDISYSNEYKNYNGPFKSAMKELLNIYKRQNTARVDCTRRTTDAAALICNCVNEGLTIGDPSHMEVNRTVLTRAVIKGRSIKRTVWAPSQFSWTIRRHRTIHTAKGNNLKVCVRSAMKAVALGPNGYDHYLNNNIASPRWFRGAAKCTKAKRGVFVVGAHTFSRSSNTLKKKPKYNKYSEQIRLASGNIIR